MTIREISELYQQSPRVGTLIEGLSRTGTSRFQLRGLAGSAGAFIACSVVKQTSCSHLFILPDKEAAAYFLNDLEGLLGIEEDESEYNIPVLFLPASYRKPYQVEDTD